PTPGNPGSRGFLRLLGVRWRHHGADPLDGGDRPGDLADQHGNRGAGHLRDDEHCDSSGVPESPDGLTAHELLRLFVQILHAALFFLRPPWRVALWCTCQASISSSFFSWRSKAARNSDTAPEMTPLSSAMCANMSWELLAIVSAAFPVFLVWIRATATGPTTAAIVATMTASVISQPDARRACPPPCRRARPCPHRRSEASAPQHAVPQPRPGRPWPLRRPCAPRPTLRRCRTTASRSGWSSRPRATRGSSHRSCRPGRRSKRPSR